jgi:arylsulfatase A-like enzyme
MPRPNVLLFMPDQLRADALGCFGSAVGKHRPTKLWRSEASAAPTHGHSTRSARPVAYR